MKLRKVKKDILNVDVNDTTNNMIDDIVSCFQDSMESGLVIHLIAYGNYSEDYRKISIKNRVR